MTDSSFNADDSSPTIRRGISLIALGLIIFYAVLLVRRAWLCDDAFITFRTVDNFLNGYRLTWNVTERVQAYTHPLWMFLLSLAVFITRDFYFTSLALSAALSIAAVALASRKLALSETGAVFGLTVLALSRAFVDFSTSGLENPLSHFLIVLFLIQFFACSPSPRRLFFLSLTASFGLTNRMDLALIFLPPLLYAWIGAGLRRGLKPLLLGQLPFIVWELFSLFYYGFLFPNTAYAKLNTGIPAVEMLQQGLFYLLNGLRFDPLTLAATALGLASAAFRRERRELLVALGGLAYLAYVVKIGGDFMSGRFLTVPLMVAVILLMRADFSSLKPLPTAALFALALVLGLNVTNPTVRINDLGPIDSGPIHEWDHGILDERMYYYGGTGLLNAPRSKDMPTFFYAVDGEKARISGSKVSSVEAIGMFGLRAGPGVYILDKLALADPLLARLPAFYTANWRVGHYERALPDGYNQTLELGRNVIGEYDPDLALYYDKLMILVKGNLSSPQRLVEIWKMNTGQYDHLIDRDRYRYPKMTRADYAVLSAPVPGTASCDSPGVTLLNDNGIEVLLPETSYAPWLEISLDHDDRYKLVYLSGKDTLATQSVPTAWLPDPGGLSVRVLPVPQAAARQGFDRVRIFPAQGEGAACLGYLKLRED